MSNHGYFCSVCWNFSAGHLDFHSGTLVYGWQSKSVFFGEKMFKKEKKRSLYLPSCSVISSLFSFHSAQNINRVKWSPKFEKLINIRYTLKFLYYFHIRLKPKSLEGCERKPKGLYYHPCITFSIASRRIWATVTRHPLQGFRNSCPFGQSVLQMCGPYWLVKISSTDFDHLWKGISFWSFSLIKPSFLTKGRCAHLV